MSKFHVNPANGAVGRCRAKIRCPFGGNHFSSMESAKAGAAKIIDDHARWEATKESLTAKARKLLDETGYRGVLIKWSAFLEAEDTRNMVFGKVVSGRLRRTVCYSDELRFLSSLSQHRTILHEVSHVQTKKDLDHGAEWEEKFRKNMDEHEEFGLLGTEILSRTALSPAERNAIMLNRKNNPKMTAHATCKNGHEFFATSFPLRREKCDVCGLARVWQPNDRK